MFACAAASTVTRQASAQALPLALDRATPAPAGDPLLYTDSAIARRGLALGLLGSYAHKPLVSSLTIRDTTTGETTKTNVVNHQLVGHAQAAYGVGPLLVEAGLPVVLSQGGDDVIRNGKSLATSGGGAAIGDLRLGVRLVALSPRPGGVPFGAALGFRYYAPTGDTSRYASTGNARYAPSITFGHAGERWVWAFSTSFLRKRLATSPAGIGGSEAAASLGVARRFGSFQAGVEAFGATVADGQTAAFGSHTTNAEVAGVLRQQVGPARFTLAAGPGLGLGVGTPAFRALLGVEIVLEKAAPSVVTERIETAPPPGSPKAAVSAQPSVVVGKPASAEAATPGTATPVVASPVVPPPTKAADRDADGIADPIDACPDVPGVASLELTKHGCPADTDGDGIVDTADACPRQAGPKQADPKTSGCPEAVRLSATEIVILQQVQFEVGSDRIAQASFPLLTQVAEAIKQNPDIVRVSVDGHTDDVGVAAKNLTLSQRRAVAVVRWLTEHGVDARRLESRGFGSRRPLVAEKTPAARSKNRRVEFLVKKRDAAGQAAWTDGPVP